MVEGSFGTIDRGCGYRGRVLKKGWITEWGRSRIAETEKSTVMSPRMRICLSTDGKGVCS